MLTLLQGTGGRPQRHVALIKEWRDVLAEVGDHQSLVASLRTSAYYNMFKDEVSSWEGKLGLLQVGILPRCLPAHPSEIATTTT